MLGKLKGAVAARQDPNLVIIGRTAVLRFLNLDEAKERVKAYAETGVDAIFLTGIKSWDQLEGIHQATSLPLMLGGAPADMSDKDRLAANGVRIALQGHMPFYAAIKAVHDTLKFLRDGGAPSDLGDRTASGELLDVAMKLKDYDRWQSDYLN